MHQLYILHRKLIILPQRYDRKKTIIIGLLIAAVSTVITVSIPADRNNTGKSLKLTAYM